MKLSHADIWGWEISPALGIIMHGHLGLTAPQTHLRTNCFLNPMQLKVMHEYKHLAKRKPAKLRNQSRWPA